MRPKFVVDEGILLFHVGAQQSLHVIPRKTAHTTYHCAYQDMYFDIQI